MTRSQKSPWISMSPSLTVPPLPQRFFRSPASAFRAISSTWTPVTTVTVLPPRPLVSLRTRTIPSPACRDFCFLQLQEETGSPHPGHIRPFSDDQTSTESALLFFIAFLLQPRLYTISMALIQPE